MWRKGVEGKMSVDKRGRREDECKEKGVEGKMSVR